MIGVPGHRASLVRRAARSRHFGDPDFAGQLRAFDLFRDSRGGGALAPRAVVRQAFDSELRQGQIQSVEVTPGCSILAVVGDGMAGSHGVAAKVFGALGNAAVSVRAIAQGASERNISVVIDGKQASRALRSVHSSFYLSPHTISIGLIGPGVVGGALLDQLASQVERLSRELKARPAGARHHDLEAHAARRSRGAACTLARCFQCGRTSAADLTRFAEHIHADHLPHAIIIDCSASADVAARYPAWLGSGIHIVTPNKKANSADLELYARLHEARRQGGAHYLYEATVGAGLPIIQTLRDLRDTGDEIQRIEGILSGTLAYLFNVWDGTRAVLGDRARREGEGLHRARSAR